MAESPEQLDPLVAAATYEDMVAMVSFFKLFWILIMAFPEELKPQSVGSEAQLAMN